jgi:hypothetical protein
MFEGLRFQKLGIIPAAGIDYSGHTPDLARPGVANELESGGDLPRKTQPEHSRRREVIIG